MNHKLLEKRYSPSVLPKRNLELGKSGGGFLFELVKVGKMVPVDWRIFVVTEFTLCGVILAS